MLKYALAVVALLATQIGADGNRLFLFSNFNNIEYFNVIVLILKSKCSVPVCKVNEKPGACKPAPCYEKTCGDLNISCSASCNETELNYCHCDDGFVRDPVTEKCVSITQCKEMLIVK